MNKLIPGAYFSVRAAREQRLRQSQELNAHGLYQDGDCIDHSNYGSRLAEGFRRQDPTGEKLARLINEVSGS